MAITAFILIRVEPGKSYDVARAVQALGGVKLAYEVMGPYDVAAIAEVPDESALSELLRVAFVPGVSETLTLRTLPAVLDIQAIVSWAVSRFRFRVTFKAQQMLIDMGLKERYRLEEDLQQGKFTLEEVAQGIEEVLGTAAELAKQKGKDAIEPDELSESMAMTCSFKPWC